jgi:hypothetical protein
VWWSSEADRGIFLYCSETRRLQTRLYKSFLSRVARVHHGTRLRGTVLGGDALGVLKRPEWGK